MPKWGRLPKAGRGPIISRGGAWLPSTGPGGWTGGFGQGPSPLHPHAAFKGVCRGIRTPSPAFSRRSQDGPGDACARPGTSNSLQGFPGFNRALPGARISLSQFRSIWPRYQVSDSLHVCQEGDPGLGPEVTDQGRAEYYRWLREQDRGIRSSRLHPGV